MKVARLSVTPVKGMQLQDRSWIDLAANGVSDNRRFYVIDERGLMFNGKKDGRLALVAVEYEQHREHLRLHFPDGKDVADVWVAGEAVITSFYGRPVAGRLVIGPWSQALSEFIGHAVRLVAVDRLGDAVDVHPVTLISQASIAKLSASQPGAERLDYRRFRMLFEVDGSTANEEDSWTGRRVHIGSAGVEVVGPVPRCVVVSQNPKSGRNDFDMLRAIVAYRGALSADLQTPTAHLPDGGKIIFGMYGRVVQSGRIAVGDNVTIFA